MTKMMNLLMTTSNNLITMMMMMMLIMVIRMMKAMIIIMVMTKVSVTIVDDNQWEPDEEFFLKLALVKKVLNHSNECDIRIFTKCPKAIAYVAFGQPLRCLFSTYKCILGL